MPIRSSASRGRASSSGAGASASFSSSEQLARQRREIVDEVQRVLDLVGDAGGELAERSELFRLDQPVLRLAQVVERGASSRVRACTSSNSRAFSMRDHRLVGEGLHDLDLPRR